MHRFTHSLSISYQVIYRPANTPFVLLVLTCTHTFAPYTPLVILSLIINPLSVLCVKALSYENALSSCRKVARWGNGLACLQQWLCYLKGPGFESHLQPVEFFACNKVSPVNN